MSVHSRKVGVVGLGAMGLGVAQSLVRSGFETHVFDLRREQVEKIVAAGGHGHDDPVSLAAHVDTLIVLVVNAAQSEAVLFGEGGAATHLKPGSVVIASATVSPEFAQSLGTRLNGMGLSMIDGPVSGGSVRAAAGQLTIMASGPAEAFAACQDMLDAIAAKVYRIGERYGQGSTVKMVNQLLAGVHIAAAAEAMALGIRAGADPAILYEVICNSAGASWMFENRVPHILKNDYTPHSAVNIFIKDLGIVLDYAGKSAFPLPLSATAMQMYKEAAAAGYGGQDDSAVIKIFPDVKLPGA